MTEPRSALTGRRLGEEHLVIRRRFEEYSRPFDLYRCPDTGIVQTVPLPDPEELARREYTDDYSSYREKRPAAARNTTRRRLRWISAHLERRGSPRLLEVGCSTGWFLAEARGRGFTVLGVEPVSFAACRARRLLGESSVVCGTIDDVPPERGPFDIVYANQVIEHVLDPAAFVGGAHSLLASGGLIALGTPDISSLAWHRWRGAWPSVQKPEHLFFFDRESLAGLLERGGFEVLSTRTTGTPPLGRRRRLPEVTSNVNRAAAAGDARGGLLGRLKHKVLASRVGSEMAALVIHKLRLGDTFFVVARRRR